MYVSSSNIYIYICLKNKIMEEKSSTALFVDQYPNFIKCAVGEHDCVEYMDYKDPRCRAIKKYRKHGSDKIILNVNDLLKWYGPMNGLDADYIIRVLRQCQEQHPFAKIMLDNESFRPDNMNEIKNKEPYEVRHAAFKKAIDDALEVHSTTPLMLPLKAFFVKDVYLNMFDDYPDGPYYPY